MFYRLFTIFYDFLTYNVSHTTFQVPDGSDDEGTDEDQPRNSAEERTPASDLRNLSPDLYRAPYGDTNVIDLTDTRANGDICTVIDLSTPSGSPASVYGNNELSRPAEDHTDDLDVTLGDHSTRPSSAEHFISREPLPGHVGPANVPDHVLAFAKLWDDLRPIKPRYDDTDDVDRSEFSDDDDSEMGYSADGHKPESYWESDDEANEFSSPVYDEDHNIHSEGDSESEDTGSISAETDRGK